MSLRACLAVLLLLAISVNGWADVPQRVVSVGGTVTEIAFALGRGDRLVAADTTSGYPEAALALPRVGYMRTLSAEGVLSLKPQLVLVTADAGPPAALSQLRAAGVHVVSINADHSFDAVLTKVRSVGQALDAAGAAAALEKRLNDEWRQATARVESLPGKPRVLFLLAHAGNNPMVAGRDTAADAMIRLAGGVNAMAEFSGYKPLTAEAVAGAAPDFLLITREGVETLGSNEKVWSQPGLALTPAGRSRRLVSMDALYLLGFGPRLPAAVRELAERLHTP
jgi:iron complex transport system substrate-binding protein